MPSQPSSPPGQLEIVPLVPLLDVSLLLPLSILASLATIYLLGSFSSSFPESSSPDALRLFSNLFSLVSFKLGMSAYKFFENLQTW